MIARFTPTGDATAGSPDAMYWRSLNPHFPRVHGPSSSGMMPISKLTSWSLSVSMVQGA
jgi:hypothetical protein